LKRTEGKQVVTAAENSEETAKPTSRGRPFQPGQSGNPGGRPKDVGIVRDLARAHTESAVLTLVAIMTNSQEKGAARVAAAQAILDRGWGKAVQALDVARSEGAPLKIIVEYANDSAAHERKG
jgi:hypothetical protein